MLNINLLNELIEEPEPIKSIPTELKQKEEKVISINNRRYLKEKEVKALYTEQTKVMEANIRASERLRAEINKDIASNKPLAEVLDKSLKVIGLMTGDNVFYEMNVKNIRELKG